jgi:hypothetical protein
LFLSINFRYKLLLSLVFLCCFKIDKQEEEKHRNKEEQRRSKQIKMLNFYDKYESKISREKFYNTVEKNFNSNNNINPVRKHRFKTIKTNDLLKQASGVGGVGTGGGSNVGGGVGVGNVGGVGVGGGVCLISNGGVSSSCGIIDDSKIKGAKSKSCVDTSKPAGVVGYLPYTASGKYEKIIFLNF